MIRSALTRIVRRIDLERLVPARLWPKNPRWRALLAVLLLVFFVVVPGSVTTCTALLALRQAVRRGQAPPPAAAPQLPLCRGPLIV